MANESLKQSDPAEYARQVQLDTLQAQGFSYYQAQSMIGNAPPGNPLYTPTSPPPTLSAPQPAQVNYSPKVQAEFTSAVAAGRLPLGTSISQYVSGDYRAAAPPVPTSFSAITEQARGYDIQALSASTGLPAQTIQAQFSAPQSALGGKTFSSELGQYSYGNLAASGIAQAQQTGSAYLVGFGNINLSQTPAVAPPQPAAPVFSPIPRTWFDTTALSQPGATGGFGGSIKGFSTFFEATPTGPAPRFVPPSEGVQYAERVLSPPATAGAEIIHNIETFEQLSGLSRLTQYSIPEGSVLYGLPPSVKDALTFGVRSTFSYVFPLTAFPTTGAKAVVSIAAGGASIPYKAQEISAAVSGGYFPEYAKGEIGFMAQTAEKTLQEPSTYIAAAVLSGAMISEKYATIQKPTQTYGEIAEAQVGQGQKGYAIARIREPTTGELLPGKMQTGELANYDLSKVKIIDAEYYQGGKLTSRGTFSFNPETSEFTSFRGFGVSGETPTSSIGLIQPVASQKLYVPSGPISTYQYSPEVSGFTSEVGYRIFQPQAEQAAYQGLTRGISQTLDQPYVYTPPPKMELDLADFFFGRSQSETSKSVGVIHDITSNQGITFYGIDQKTATAGGIRGQTTYVSLIDPTTFTPPQGFKSFSPSPGMEIIGGSGEASVAVLAGLSAQQQATIAFKVATELAPRQTASSVPFSGLKTGGYEAAIQIQAQVPRVSQAEASQREAQTYSPFPQAPAFSDLQASFIRPREREITLTGVVPKENVTLREFSPTLPKEGGIIRPIELTKTILKPSDKNKPITISPQNILPGQKIANLQVQPQQTQEIIVPSRPAPPPPISLPPYITPPFLFPGSRQQQMGGEGFVRDRRVSRRAYRYTPSLTSSFLGLKGRVAKSVLSSKSPVSGLEIRPIASQMRRNAPKSRATPKQAARTPKPSRKAITPFLGVFKGMPKVGAGGFRMPKAKMFSGFVKMRKFRRGK